MRHRQRIQRAMAILIACSVGAALGAAGYLAAAPVVRVAAAASDAPKAGDCLDVPIEPSPETGLPEASGAPYIVDCASDHHMQVLSLAGIPADVAAWLPDDDDAKVGISRPQEAGATNGSTVYSLDPLRRYDEMVCGAPDSPAWASSGVVHAMVYPSRTRWEWESPAALCIVSLTDYSGHRSLTRKIPGGVDLSGQWWQTVPESIWRQCQDEAGDSIPCGDPAVARIAAVDAPMTGPTAGDGEPVTAAEVLTPIAPADYRSMYGVCRTAMFQGSDVYPRQLSLTMRLVATPHDMDYACFLPLEHLQQYTGRLDRSVLAEEVAR